MSVVWSTCHTAFLQTCFRATDRAIEHPIKHPSTVLVSIPLNMPLNAALSIEAKLGVGGCGFAIC